MGIKALGYVIIETTQPERWDHFLTELAGVMRAPDAADGAMQFRIDARPFRLRITKGGKDHFTAAGYEVADAAALDALAAAVAAAGRPVEAGSADEAALLADARSSAGWLHGRPGHGPLRLPVDA